MQMLIDHEFIISFYSSFGNKTENLRKKLNRPLSYAEKILYAHLYNENSITTSDPDGYKEFRPDRVIMQDATAQMALLQFMTAGKDKTAVPSSVHCDHLVLAHFGADKDLSGAKQYNKEVYDFLKDVSNKYGIDYWEAGAGIIHQVAFENYAFPGGLMVGTDSHTPNAGGLGMVAVGVGGADAVDVMTGMPWEMKFPKILGVKLTGRLNGWTSAKDIILKIAGILTVQGGTGFILEYFGDGAESLSCTGKSTICNMGAEIGATSSVFPYDNKMKKYLIATGRTEIAIEANNAKELLRADVEVYADPEKYFDKVIEIDLNTLEPYINGPFTPDRAIPISQMKRDAERNGWPIKLSAGLIGSCTNSSFQDLGRAASVIRSARSKKIPVAAKLYINPGSSMIYKVAEEEGIIKEFSEAGCTVFANACGPCIGQWKRDDNDSLGKNSIVTSFNRNFAKRNDGNAGTHAFVASPEIVAALTVAGKLDFNPITDTLKTLEGTNVRLDEPLAAELPENGFITELHGYHAPDLSGSAATINIDPASERLQVLEPFKPWNSKDSQGIPLLIKVKGKCTTDHISMAGPWLKYRGHLDNICGNFMIGAMNAFNEKPNSVLNQLKGSYCEVPETARDYSKFGTGSFIAGDENYGEGSSREHAAMEPRYLNVKAVIVKSFARIHETNLKKQGVLALTFADKNDYEKIRENDHIDIVGLDDFKAGKALEIVLHHSDESTDTITANHTYNALQIEWFKAGSALNYIKLKSTNTK